MKKIISAALLFVSTVMAPPAWSTILPTTFEALTQGADLICLAHVQKNGIQSYQMTNPHGDQWIESTVQLDIEKCLKGSGPRVIEVRILGGKIGDWVETNSVSAEFEEREHVIVFLKKILGGYRIYKNFLGKYTISNQGTLVETGQSYTDFLKNLKGPQK